ncbi:MAG: hypothetical protein A2V93_11430 [Ignavibacteria bacterium RBG_16_34_14]|nr:MAG: hypothetical protein A2V93_11430 [Ignavibacteria bacterium RBG_16_34_14]
MNDTSPEAKKIQDELFAKLSGEERLLMGLEMFETARKIVLSSFPENLPENEIRKRLFLRFYENDFSDEEKEKILKRMDEYFKDMEK